MAKVFVSYVREDRDHAERLAADLERHGVDVWIDRTRLKPGDRWADEIRKGIAEGDFFLACFSENVRARSRSYMHEELTLAVDELRQRASSHTWFIPVRLSDCQIPDRSIGGGQTLRSLQWVDLFDDWSGGVLKILAVVRPQGVSLVLNSDDVQVFGHQVASWLFSIRGVAKDLGRGAFRKSELRTVSSELESMAMLALFQVSGFLAVASVIQDHSRVYRSSVDLGREVTDVVRLMAPLARVEGMKVRVRGLKQLPERIRADSSLIGQLIYLLLDNALKYSHSVPEGGVGDVVIECSYEPPNAVLRFTNKGDRIHSDEVDQIFAPGYRGRAATTTMGTGQGLALARRIVVAHGGKVTLDADESGVNSFTVLLPTDEFASDISDAQSEARPVKRNGSQSRPR